MASSPLDSTEAGRSRALTAIKISHTAIWMAMVACIAAIPVAAWLRDFRVAAALSAVVWLECGALAANSGRCPLTNLAEKYTSRRHPNFDIYLPRWLARWNKAIFGTIFVVNELLALGLWLRGR